MLSFYAEAIHGLRLVGRVGAQHNAGEGGVVERFLPGNAIPPLQSIEYEETGVAWLRDLRLSGNKEYSPSPLENR